MLLLCSVRQSSKAGRKTQKHKLLASQTVVAAEEPLPDPGSDLPLPCSLPSRPQRGPTQGLWAQAHGPAYWACPFPNELQNRAATPIPTDCL